MGRKKMSDKTQTQNEGTAQKTIEGSTHVGGQEIQAVTTEDDRDILGWIVPFTIGNDFVVPRDWLEQRARELNLSPNVLPSPTSEKRAFTRAGGRVDGRQVAEIEKKENVDLHLEKVRYKRIYHLEVHDRREEGEFDGEVIGVLKFEDDELDVRPKVTPEHEMWDAWNAYVGAFKDEFDLMANSNLGEDIRHMMTNLFQSRSWSVKFRAGGGVYFAPPAIEGVVKAIDQLITDYEAANELAINVVLNEINGSRDITIDIPAAQLGVESEGENGNLMQHEFEFGCNRDTSASLAGDNDLKITYNV